MIYRAMAYRVMKTKRENEIFFFVEDERRRRLVKRK